MSIFTVFVSGFSRFVSLPLTTLSLLLSNYFLLIFFGGLIFFVANTPYADLVAIYDAFTAVVTTNNGSFGNVITAIVTACQHFATNVKHNFDPATLSAAVTNGLCTIMSFAGLRSC